MWRTLLSAIPPSLVSPLAYADDKPFVPDEIVDRVATEASILVIVLLILLAEAAFLIVLLLRYIANREKTKDEILEKVVKAMADNTGAVEALRSSVDHTNHITALSSRIGGSA